MKVFSLLLLLTLAGASTVYAADIDRPKPYKTALKSGNGAPCTPVSKNKDCRTSTRR